MWKWLNFFRKVQAKEPEHPHNRIRRTVDANTIRARLNGLGWQVIERPLKRSNPDPAKREIYQWRIIAIKNEHSYEVTGKDLNEAMLNMGKSLGVVSN